MTNNIASYGPPTHDDKNGPPDNQIGPPEVEKGPPNESLTSGPPTHR